MGGGRRALGKGEVLVFALGFGIHFRQSYILTFIAFIYVAVVGLVNFRMLC